MSAGTALSNLELNKVAKGSTILLGAGITFWGAATLYKKNQTFKTTVDWTRQEAKRWQRGYEFIVSAITIGLIPDLASQISSSNKFSLPRFGSTTLFGGICGAFFNRELYNFLNHRLPDDKPSSIIRKTAFIQAVYVPYFFMPIFYTFKTLVLGNSFSGFIGNLWQFENDILPINWFYWLPVTYGIFKIGVNNSDLMVYAAGIFSAIWFSVLYSIGLN